MRNPVVLLLLAGLSLVASNAATRAQPTPAPIIAAAADLQFALAETAEAFKTESGDEIKLVVGSSGNFVQQIRRGAPFQLYFSADEAYVDQLSKEGLTRDAGELYAVGRIVLFVPQNSPLKADASFADLKAATTDGRLQKFAVANPEHAPYGKRAEEALRDTGLWDAIEKKLVLGENVAQAAHFVTSGAAQGGIIAYSLALSPKVSELGSFAVIPEDWHQPLRQRMVLLKGAGDAAERFYAFVKQPKARAIMRKYGFVLPGD